MKRALALLALIFLACLAGLTPRAHAGQACEEASTTPEKLALSMQLAQMTLKELDHSGAQLAVLGRNGQDLSRYGVRYSHMAYAWRDHPKGRWLVVHELNDCGSARSGLYNEGLGNFFFDLHRYETRIFIPGAAIQQKLVAVLGSNLGVQLHWPNYNMLAFPFSQQYQNSNQWVLEVYAAASGDMVDSRARAQAWLTLAAYQPQTIRLSAMTRLGARVARANIAFDDHPFERRMAGRIDTVTVDSVFRFMKQREPEGRDISLSVTSPGRP